MKNKSEAGYSLLELLLAVFIGSIVIAGAYASYLVVANQYNRNSSVAEIRDFAIPTMKLLSRDLRMAGHVQYDSDLGLGVIMESDFGVIDVPPFSSIEIVDAANNNCLNLNCLDSFTVIYDREDAGGNTERVLVRYYVATRTVNLITRNALLIDIENWDDNTLTFIPDPNATGAIVADFVEDFQVFPNQNNVNNNSGQPTLIDFSIVFRSRNPTTEINTFDKEIYDPGDNNDWTAADNFLREQFNTTVYLRNLSSH